MLPLDFLYFWKIKKNVPKAHIVAKAANTNIPEPAIGIRPPVEVYVTPENKKGVSVIITLIIPRAVTASKPFLTEKVFSKNV